MCVYSVLPYILLIICNSQFLYFLHFLFAYTVHILALVCIIDFWFDINIFVVDVALVVHIFSISILHRRRATIEPYRNGVFYTLSHYCDCHRRHHWQRIEITLQPNTQTKNATPLGECIACFMAARQQCFLSKIPSVNTIFTYKTSPIESVWLWLFSLMADLIHIYIGNQNNRYLHSKVI